MIDVLIITNINEESLSAELLNNFSVYKKYLCKNLKGLLNSSEVSNKVVSSVYKKDLDEDIKCFLDIEINRSSTKNYLEIFSPKVVNKSYELATYLAEILEDRVEINYNDIDSKNKKLSNRTAKLFLKLYINNEEGDIEKFLETMAKLISIGLGKYLGVNMSLINPKVGIKLINENIIDKNKAKQFSKNIGLSDKLIELIDYYWDLSKDHGNVDPLVAYAQAIVTAEENKVSYDYLNPGGIKEFKPNSEGNYDYKKFSSIKEGIIAQLDHLALFGGADGYPRATTNDPRHFKYLLGCCETVESLSGKWEAEKDYGDKIIKIYNEIGNIEKFEKFSENKITSLSVESNIDRFNDRLIAMGNLLENVFKEYSILYKDLEEIRKEVLSATNSKKEIEDEKVKLEQIVFKQKSVIKDILNVIGGSLEKK